VKTKLLFLPGDLGKIIIIDDLASYHFSQVIYFGYGKIGSM